MNRVPVLIVVLLFLVAGCSKDQAGSKPTLKIVSITQQVPLQGTFDAVLSYDSKKGDMGNGQLLVYRQRLNQHPLPPTTTPNDTFKSVIPSFPDQQSAQFDWSFGWAQFLEGTTENDTITLKFIAVSRSGDSSDAITSPQIVIYYQ